MHLRQLEEAIFGFMAVLIDRFELRLIVQGFESMLARMNKRITDQIEINFN